MNGKSFEEYCKESGNLSLLDIYDYELNKLLPSEIGHTSMIYTFFKCPRGLHESRMIPVGNITKAYKNDKKYCICHKCNSIGQYIVDKYSINELRCNYTPNGFTSIRKK